MADWKDDESFVDPQFAVHGPMCVKNGWSVFPQEPRGERRPEVVDGVQMAWKYLQKRQPTADEIKSWGAQCPKANTALVSGYKGIFGLDLDVTEERLVWDLRQKAEEIMGKTMIRFGRRPLFVYRCEEQLHRKAYAFTPVEGEIEKQVIEVLAAGSAFTGFGRHHKTGEFFRWKNGTPLLNRPEDATLVTDEQLRRFLEAANKLRPFKGTRPLSKGAIIALDQPVHYTMTGKVMIPHAWPDDERGRWDLVDGVVVSGREKFLLAWTYAICSCAENRHLLSSEVGLRQLAIAAAADAYNSVARDGKSERWMEKNIADKIRRTAAKFLKGELGSSAPLIPKEGGGYQRAIVQTAQSQTVLADPALDWLGSGDVIGKVSAYDRELKTTEERAIEGALEERSLRTDRTETLARLDAEVNAALDEALADVVAENPVVHVIPAPTGTGKTRTTAHRLGGFLASRTDTKPTLFLAPTHENLTEGAQHFRDAGVVFFGDEGFDTAPVKGTRYMGKLLAGCDRDADVRKMRAAGFGSFSLCQGKVRRQTGMETVDGYMRTMYEWEKATCPHAGTCGFQLMRRAASESKLILAPHAYLTLKAVPVEMKDPLEVVVDESIVSKQVHCEKMPLSVLDMERAPPTPTKAEKANKVDMAQYLVSRDRGVAVVKHAIASGADIAETFLEAEFGNVKICLGFGPKGDEIFLEQSAVPDLIADCLAVTGRALEVVREINPESTSADIEHLTSGAKAQYVHLEWRLWKQIEERIADRKADKVAETVQKLTGLHMPRRCKMGRDMSLQILSDLVSDEEVLSIRISWLTTPNWIGAPTILLDASAQKEVVESLYQGCEVKHHNITVDLNMRTVAVADSTYSTSSMTGDDEDIGSAQRVEKVRRALSVVAGRHSDGSVVFGAAKTVRAQILHDWTEPLNMGDGHFGAFRGIDVFKDHLAAFGLGRSEQPIWVVDGYVAALTYKRCPQIPFDVSGTGRLPNGRPLQRPKMPRTIKKRSGHDVDLLVPQMPSKWGQIVERQWREEELSQFGGRLRPVRRSDTPTLILATTCLPENLIIDRMVTLDDILAAPGAMVLDAMRETGGVVDSVALGFDVGEFISDNWSAPGFTRLEWTDTQGQSHKALVASSWQADPREALRSALNVKGLLYLWPQAEVDPDTLVETPSELVAVSEPNAVVKLGGVRKPDALRQALLSADDRAALKCEFEAWWRVNKAEFAKIEGGKRTASILFARSWKKPNGEIEA